MAAGAGSQLSPKLLRLCKAATQSEIVRAGQSRDCIGASLCYNFWISNSMWCDAGLCGWKAIDGGSGSSSAKLEWMRDADIGAAVASWGSDSKHSQQRCHATV